MSLSMYNASVPVFLQLLGAQSAVLDKAAAHAEARKIEPAIFLNTRLYPDMYPFVRQVQIASDTAKGAGARLAGIEVPSYADTEASFPELKARVAKTMDFLKTLKPEQIDGSETREIVLQMRTGAMSFNGEAYLLTFALPNFFFHVTTAYAILRHCGVELGKRDFVMAPR